MQINTYLSFDGQCKEAFEWYNQILGGKITFMMTNGESPIRDQMPPETHSRIMHARLEGKDFVLMGGDSPPQYNSIPAGFCVSIQVDDTAEAERVFGLLAEGGKVNMPIGETFWAARFGMCIDRFRTPWMVNCEKPEA